MINQHIISEILFIVVLYKKRISESESIQSIQTVLEDNQLHFYIYDNSPEYNYFDKSKLNLATTFYVADAKNSGVSRAYNLGAKLASERNKKWLMLCDQDTEFTPEYFDSLCRIIHNFEPNLVAPYLFSNLQLISPCAFTMNYGHPLKKMPVPGWTMLKKIALLNSGMVISREAFEKCGGYAEDVFLDFSDFDFLKKYRKIFGEFYLMDVRIEHHLESVNRKDFNSLRFIKYCQSYKGAMHNLFDILSLTLIVLFRTFKLCFFHGEILPLKLFLLYFLMNRKLVRDENSD
jgi:GT2 family glycosyltransferase